MPVKQEIEIVGADELFGYFLLWLHTPDLLICWHTKDGWMIDVPTGDPLLDCVQLRFKPVEPDVAKFLDDAIITNEWVIGSMKGFGYDPSAFEFAKRQPAAPEPDARISPVKDSIQEVSEKQSGREAKEEL